MSVIIILILASLAVGLVFVTAFVWSVRNGQYEDTLTPAMRVLADDDGKRAENEPVPSPDPEQNQNGNKKKNMSRQIKIAGLAVLSTASLSLAVHAADCCSQSASTNWLENTISPVANPLFFEDPRVTSGVRPVYMYHWLPSTFDFAGGSVPLGGQVQVMAVQLRYALTDKLGLIATKDGYIEFQPDHTLGHAYGWGDLAAGLKYVVYDNQDDQIIVTPGVTITIPTGSTEVFQGNGSGVWNAFVSAEKGFDKFHATVNAGFNIPNNLSQQTAQTHYSLQLDYYTCQYFVPFAVMNGYTILSETSKTSDQSLSAVPLNTEGYDLINFGSSQARGTTQLTVGGGARSRLAKNIDVGVAYEAGVVHPVGIFDTRLTVDLIWRF